MEGEENLLLKQIHEMSKDILDDLMEIDNKVAAIEDNIKAHDELNKDEILQSLKEIRSSIGAMEKEDIEEMKEEEILENMNSKLRKLIEMALGD